MNKGLKKEDSAALKGVAILLMVFVHCFRSADLLEEFEIVFRGMSSQQVLDFIPYGKICVSIFAFISGYGLMYSYTVNKKTKSLSVRGWTASHVLKTLSGFWFVSVLFYVVFIIISQGNFNDWGETAADRAAAILVDIAGFSGIMNTTSLNGTWWYMSAAVIYVLFLPFFADLLERYGVLFCIALCAAVPRIFGIEYQGGNSVLTFWSVFMTGALFYRYELFDKFREWNPINQNTLNHIFKFLLLIILIILGKKSFLQIQLPLYWEYCFALVAIPVILFCSEYLFKIKPVQKILVLLGKHSMNIWLIHTFVRDRDRIRDVIYSMKEAILIFLVILLISFLSSFVLEFLKKITGYNRLINCAVKKAGQIP